MLVSGTWRGGVANTANVVMATVVHVSHVGHADVVAHPGSLCCLSSPLSLLQWLKDHLHSGFVSIDGYTTLRQDKDRGMHAKTKK